MNQVIVTTSWDDGHKLDLRLAELLSKYGFKATFYISPKNQEFSPASLLSSTEILELSKKYEIGSHSMTHPVMTHIPLTAVEDELKISKDYLENLTGQAVNSFCYPRGAYSQSIVNKVKSAGYKYARTVHGYELSKPTSELEAGTSLEAHRLSVPKLWSELSRISRYCRWNPLRIVKNLSWENRAKIMFDDAYNCGGVFHLWGHSWVIEKEKSWEKLESVLAYIHSHPGIRYTTNVELVEEAKQ